MRAANGFIDQVVDRRQRPQRPRHCNRRERFVCSREPDGPSADEKRAHPQAGG
jgi:hypothetical protein